MPLKALTTVLSDGQKLETLKRFRSLCSRGAYDPRTLARQLQVSHVELPASVLEAGLQMLAELDGRAALHGYFGPQLHLFAGNDALVPASACAALQRWMPGILAELVPGASHGLPLERADDVAATMVAFIKGNA